MYNKYGKKKYGIISKDIHKGLWQSTYSIEARNFREFVDKLCSIYCSESKAEVIGVKIAGNMKDNVSLIKNIFPDAYCIHIIRDPRDILVSLRKVPFETKSAYILGKNWIQTINAIRQLRKLPNYYEIRYESLLTDPVKEIKGICKFLNLKYNKKMLDFHKNITGKHSFNTLIRNKIAKDNTGKWKKVLSKKDLKLLYSVASKDMFSEGYLDRVYYIHIGIFDNISEYLKDFIRKLRYFDYDLPNRIYLKELLFLRGIGVK
ncbi:MAG: sulfotransferase [archaeon]